LENHQQSSDQNKLNSMNRKTFIKSTVAGITLAAVTPQLIYSRSIQDEKPFDRTLVKEFVSAGHKDLNKVKEMLSEHPNLINSSYDWGGGDFEEAIEGAGHLGNKEIAEYLINQGARVNLFVLTMLGKISLVKPILEAYPNLIFAKGPHGFTLLHHAKVGGQDKFSDYLKDNGLVE